MLIVTALNPSLPLGPTFEAASSLVPRTDIHEDRSSRAAAVCEGWDAIAGQLVTS